jgi:phage-related protein
MGFSKQGLYEQLSSEYGAGFTAAEAQYAVDHVDANWNKEAVESAQSYLDSMPMSRQALIEQLTSEYGAGFTYEQAVYAVNKVY